MTELKSAEAERARLETAEKAFSASFSASGGRQHTGDGNSSAGEEAKDGPGSAKPRYVAWPLFSILFRLRVFQPLLPADVFGVFIRSDYAAERAEFESVWTAALDNAKRFRAMQITIQVAANPPNPSNFLTSHTFAESTTYPPYLSSPFIGIARSN